MLSASDRTLYSPKADLALVEVTHSTSGAPADTGEEKRPSLPVDLRRASKTQPKTKRSGFLQPVELYASLLELCSSQRNLPGLRRAHALVIATGFAPHDFIRFKLVAAYARFGRFAEALYIFHRANRHPTFLFNTLLASFSSLGFHHRCLRFFHFMRRSGKLPDRHTFPSLLSSCAALSALHIGRPVRNFYRFVKSQPFSVQLKTKKLRLLDVYDGKDHLFFQVHSAVIVNGFDLDMANLNALLNMYSKCGCIDAARAIFDTMPGPNVVSWSAMIHAYGGHGRSEEAVALFERMVGEAGIWPDAVTFTAVLAACSHGGSMELGKKVFGMMGGRFGIRPRLEHYTCMVDMLGRAGEVEEAEKLVNGMEKVVADEALLGAFLAACRLHGKLQVAERIAKKLCQI